MIFKTIENAFLHEELSEARGNGRGEFGEESVVKILESSYTLDAGQIRDGVINAVKQFAGGENQHDDLTMVVVKAI